MNRFILCIAVVLCITSLSSPSTALLHDKTRGLKATGHTPEQIEAHARAHSNDAKIKRGQSKEELKEHPAVADFLKYKEMRKGGHPAAAGAWAGAMPHDFIPHMMADEGASM